MAAANRLLLAYRLLYHNMEHKRQGIFALSSRSLRETDVGVWPTAVRPALTRANLVFIVYAPRKYFKIICFKIVFGGFDWPHEEKEDQGAAGRHRRQGAVGATLVHRRPGQMGRPGAWRGARHAAQHGASIAGAVSAGGLCQLRQGAPEIQRRIRAHPAGRGRDAAAWARFSRPPGDARIDGPHRRRCLARAVRPGAVPHRLYRGNQIHPRAAIQRATRPFDAAFGERLRARRSRQHDQAGQEPDAEAGTPCCRQCGRHRPRGSQRLCGDARQRGRFRRDDCRRGAHAPRGFRSAVSRSSCRCSGSAPARKRSWARW